MYGIGQGVPQDYAEATKWYRLAAEQGHADAQFNLGRMYANKVSNWVARLRASLDLGVPHDDAEAVKWYRRAAEQGHAGAQFNLGVMYANKASSWVARLRASLGLGVPQDGVQAYKWFDVAASRFSASEKESRDMAVKSRDLVAAELMTPAQIAEAEKLAREWRPK